MTPLGGEQISILDQHCDDYIYNLVKLDPIAATDWGLGGPSAKLPDYSPQGHAAERELDARLLQFVRSRQWEEGRFQDEITAEALENRLTLSLDLHDSGENLRELNNIASPLQDIRDSFDLMPKNSVDDWELITERLAAVPKALAGHRESLRLAADHNHIAAARQVHLVAEQATSLGAGLHFRALTEEALPLLPFSSLKRLRQEISHAEAAFSEFATWLRSDLLPRAPRHDHVGRERYERLFNLFVGATLDLDETYEWGLDQLQIINDQQTRVAHQLYGPTVSVSEAIKLLNSDPRYTITGTKRLQEWMQATSDQALASLGTSEFDIPMSLRHLECRIAPSQEGGIYYTGPSADFSRPGCMWWSVPPGETTFHTWQERTTVFHEGAPGHHLQVGQSIAAADSLNLWRRFASWNSGHGEGWALYAEQLMVELGYQDDPGNLMGALDSQRLRAARVIVDIGIHLQKPKPGNIGGVWDADYAWEFLKSNVAMSDSFLRFELDRYLGWPGQAPSYKVGQKLWEQLRNDYEAASGAKFGATRSRQAIRREFHTRALRLGSLPMATLQKALLKR